MCHLEPSSLVAAFDIEALVGFRAVQDGLVAPNLLRYMIQCFYDVKAKVFPLLVFRNRNVLNMTDESKIVDATFVQPLTFQLRENGIHTIASPQPPPLSLQPYSPHYKLPRYGTHPPSWPSTRTAHSMPLP